MSQSRMDPERYKGSAADFDRAWAEALDQNGGFGLIYPAAQPKTQFELFEKVKAEEVDGLLERYQVTEGLVLEYGCGAAGMSIYLVNRGFEAVALDISANALSLARLNVARHRTDDGSGQLRRVAGNVLQLPFTDDAFDVVMSYGLLEHFAPEVVDAVLGEVIRTLRPGGLFLADIVPGRFSVRTLGTWLSLAGSLIAHAATLRWQRLPKLPGAYLDALYENDLDARAWSSALQRCGLQDVQGRICHPFPPLALSGWPERFYVSFMRSLRPVWRWFHRTQPPWARWWGWMHLVWGTKCHLH
jgi:SAM-dependent methyltransferase